MSSNYCRVNIQGLKNMYIISKLFKSVIERILSSKILTVKGYRSAFVKYKPTKALLFIYRSQ